MPQILGASEHHHRYDVCNLYDYLDIYKTLSLWINYLDYIC